MRALLHRPSGFVPLLLSFAALSLVIGYVAVNGTARQEDEGTAAHLWQLLMALQVLAMGFFAVRWLPEAPAGALKVLVVQVGAAIAAALPVLLLGF